MPNNVTIVCSVVGTNEMLIKFREQAKGRKKQTGDVEGSFNYEKETKETVFEFDRLVPLPETYSLYPYSSLGYELECETWGVKWGAYDHEEPIVEEKVITYRFTCANSAPRLFFQKVSKNWPNLTFIISYGGEGPTLGRFTVCNGKYLSSLQGDYNEAPEYPEDSDDEKEQVLYSERYDAWEQQYCNEHRNHVKNFMAQVF